MKIFKMMSGSSHNVDVDEIKKKTNDIMLLVFKLKIHPRAVKKTEYKNLQYFTRHKIA